MSLGKYDIEIMHNVFVDPTCYFGSPHNKIALQYISYITWLIYNNKIETKELFVLTLYVP